MENLIISIANLTFYHFPAGTVSGAPKICAMQIIKNWKLLKRKVYAGGMVIFYCCWQFDTLYCFRTAVIKDGFLYAQAGAGIVADSKPINEFIETKIKLKP